MSIGCTLRNTGWDKKLEALGTEYYLASASGAAAEGEEGGGGGELGHGDHARVHRLLLRGHLQGQHVHQVPVNVRQYQVPDEGKNLYSTFLIPFYNNLHTSVAEPEH